MQKFCNFEERHFGEDTRGKTHLTRLLMNREEIKALYGSSGIEYPELATDEIHWFKKNITDEEAK